MSRVDVMVDIETLGTSSDSTIFQISAVAFEIETGKVTKSFDRIADISKNSSMNVDGSTIKWWLNTDKELLAELLNKGEGSSSEVLGDFRRWLTNLTNDLRDIYLWGNGILFDNAMLQTQLTSFGYGYPIFYKNDRDVRTIVELASIKLGISEKELKKKFEDDSLKAHNALDDCVYQVNLVSYCYNILVGDR